MTPNNAIRSVILHATSELVRAMNELLNENEQLRAQLEKAEETAMKWAHAEAATTDTNIALQVELTEARQVIKRMATEAEELRAKLEVPV